MFPSTRESTTKSLRTTLIDHNSDETPRVSSVQLSRGRSDWENSTHFSKSRHSIAQCLSNMDAANGSRRLNEVASHRLTRSVMIGPRVSSMLGPKTSQERSEYSRLTLQRYEESEEKKYVEHLYSLSDLANQFLTHIDLNNVAMSKGLTDEAAAELYERCGPNTLTPPAKVPLWLLFLLQFLNIFMLLLIAAGLLSILAYIINPHDVSSLYLGIILLVVVVVTCYETYSQEAKSDELMEKFRAMVPEAVSCIRGGSLGPIPCDNLVVGDIIRLTSGDKVPADCRMISAASMLVDQSMITGESEAVEIVVDAADKDPLESRNLVFNGSLVVDGSGYAVVVRTGDATLIGSMVELTGDVGKNQSTLKADVELFVILITKFALVQAAVIFTVGVIRGISPLEAFVNGFIIIMVANVPQGLPSTITAALFIIADRMGKQNVFVKKLDVVETLGACSLICTDKTGTLTQNIMTVANVWSGGQSMTAAEVAAMLASTDSTSHRNQASGSRIGNALSVEILMDIAVLNSRIILESKNNGTEPSGDATELGLYRFFRDIVKARTNADIEEYRNINPKVMEIPFNSANKWQMSIHEMSGHQEPQLLMFKGAPDVLLAKCTEFMDTDGTVHPIDSEFLKRYKVAYEKYGGQGERVLGFATRIQQHTVESEENSNPKFRELIREGLVGKVRFVNLASFISLSTICAGLITLIDPPREEVPQAVRECQEAGVQVVMVTGDHPLTAAAIARNIGLISSPTREDIAIQRGIKIEDVPLSDAKAMVVHGSQMDNMTDDDWNHLVSLKEVVFARTSPEQKLTIVKKFTDAGNIVAMTGDGVNDSPALKQAAIGVAMGMNGSDVAREAADIVLLDDNFASIVVGIREGRLLFNNLKKSIAYTLTHFTPEVLPVMLWALGGLPLGISGINVLCIDLITELLPATSLAYEGPELNIMKVPPRNSKTEKLVTLQLLCYSYLQVGVIEAALCVLVYFQVFKYHDIEPDEVLSTNNEYFTSDPDDSYASDSGEVFTTSDQKRILRIVQGSFFLMIVIGQAVHIWTTRSTMQPVWHGLFSNHITIYGVICAVCSGLFFVYTPGVQVVAGTEGAPYHILLFGAALAVPLIVGWTEIRKWCLRSLSSENCLWRQFKI